MILLLIEKKLWGRGYRCNPEQLEDLWADFCLRLSLRLQGYDPRWGRSALSYLIVGCVQSAIDRNRVDRRQGEIRRQMRPSDIERFSAYVEGRDVETELNRRLDAERVKRLMEEHLSSDDRDVLEAYYLEEKSLREIARDAKCTRHAAKMRLHRARRRLKVLVDHEILQESPRRAR